MSEKNFELKLEFNLRKAAMIAVAQSLWKSPNITNSIYSLMESRKLCILTKKDFTSFEQISLKFHSSPLDCFGYSPYYKYWERTIDAVLEGTDSLTLPSKLKSDLKEIIILMGERIYHYYDKRFFRCWICDEPLPFEIHPLRHFYSFSPLGTCEMKCPLHSHLNPTLFDLFTNYEITEEIVRLRQNEILSALESFQPGLEEAIRSKKDIPFSIICVWYYMLCNRRDSNGSLVSFCDETTPMALIPEDFFNNEDYIIPLEHVVALMKDKGFAYPSLKYFTKKLLSLSVPNIYPLVRLILIRAQIVTRALERDRKLDPLLSVLNLLPPNELTEFFRLHATDVIVLILPEWPYQKLALQILDFCYKNDCRMRTRSRFLLEFIMHLIGIENKAKHSAKKRGYLRLFQTVWSRSSDRAKLSFFVKRIKVLVLESSNHQILQLIDLEGEMEDFNGYIRNKASEVLKTQKDSFVPVFVSEIMISDEEHEEFEKDYLQCFKETIPSFDDFNFKFEDGDI